MSTHPIRLFRSVRLWPADQGKVRRASWLELFFDLIFVAAVSQVGVPLGEDYSIHGLIRYSLMFLLIWWAWFGHTMYATRFDADDVVHRLLTLVQIFAAAAMAANAKQELADRDSAGFGAAYAVQRIVLVIQYLRARREPKTRQLATIYATGFGIAAILWTVAAVVPPPLRFWLWGAALLIDLSTPLLTIRHTQTVPPHPEHLAERFGLFTIILLGESVAAVMRGMESQESWRDARNGESGKLARFGSDLCVHRSCSGVWTLVVVLRCGPWGGRTSCPISARPAAVSNLESCSFSLVSVHRGARRGSGARHISSNRRSSHGPACLDSDWRRVSANDHNDSRRPDLGTP